MCTPRASASTSSGWAYSRSIRSRTRRNSARSRRRSSSARRLVTRPIVPRALQVGQQRDLLPDLVGQLGGESLDVGDGFQDDVVGAVLGTQCRGLGRQAEHLRAVAQVVVQLVGVQTVSDALLG